MQDGIPVPTFSYQPRRRLDLTGKWRVEVMPMDDDLSLAPRSSALKQIVADAAGRQQPVYDDTRWPAIDVPGSFNPPPSPTGNGAWYRKDFDVPVEWQNQTVTLKFTATELTKEQLAEFLQIPPAK